MVVKSIAASVFALACTTAMWLERREQPGLVLPHEVPIVVRVSARVTELDDDGSVAALVDTLEDELIAKGFLFRIISSPDGPFPDSRVELFVKTHDESVERKTPLKIECSIVGPGARTVFSGVLGSPFAPRRARTSGRELAEVIAAHASR